jgi:hypothetical protein
MLAPTAHRSDPKAAVRSYLWRARVRAATDLMEEKLFCGFCVTTRPMSGMRTRNGRRKQNDGFAIGGGAGLQ